MWRSAPDRSVQVFPDGTKVQRNKIPDYACDGFGECIDMWQLWERKNLLPYPGTWREQPAYIWDMLKAFDSVYYTHVNAEREMADLMRQAKAGKH
jgi:hypothetical protein